MNSMTGFARVRKTFAEGALDASLSCINKRGLEIGLALPRELAALEGVLHERLKKEFERGKLQLTVRLELRKTPAPAALRKKFDELKVACRALKADFAPDAAMVLSLLRDTATAAPNEKALEKTLEATVTALVHECQSAQAQEGRRLAKDFAARFANIEKLLAKVEKLSPQTVPLQRERLLKSLAGAGLAVDVADERVLKELALFADRVDVAEEITRIRSHLAAARKLIAAPGAIGRQLEFLLQEFLREWNTLGNKSPQVEIIQTALLAKNEIERLREQAANIA